MEPVGLVGIGLVGTAVAERLLAAGYEVVGYDTVPKKREHLASLGGTAVGGPQEVAGQAQRVVLSLLTSEQVGGVVEDLLEADAAPALIVDTTTGDPEATEALAGKLAEQGVGYVDATISGNSAQVREGEALYMVGGTGEDVEAASDLLEALTAEWVHVGPAGSGARMKLVANLVMGLNRVAIAEGLAFAEAMGLDLERVAGVLARSMAYSRIMDTKARKMVEGEYSTQARLDQHRKDVGIILEAAARLGQELPMSEAHLQVLDGAIAAGDGELDNAALMRELQRRRKRDA